MHKGVENRAIGIWDDLYRGLPGPVKSFLSVIIVSTTLMLGALFFTTQLLPGADSLIPTLVDALERQIEGQNVKNEQLEILARKMVQIAASVQQLTEELAQSNDRFQSIGRCAAPRCDDFARALPRERWRQLSVGGRYARY